MVTNLYRDMMRSTVQQTGMSKTRLEILDVLADVDELTQAELQQQIGVESPVITRIVKQLEAEGLVTRRPDPRDNRYTLVALRSDLREMRTDVDLMMFKEKFGAQIMQGISEEERAMLLSALKRVRENLQAQRDASTEPTATKVIGKLRGK